MNSKADAVPLPPDGGDSLPPKKIRGMSALQKAWYIGGCVALAGLGVWQSMRYVESSRKTERVASMSAAPALAIEQIDAAAPPYYRRVKIKGAFKPNSLFHLYTGARSPRGSPGYDELALFAPSNGSPPVIVNLGWIPDKAKESGARPALPTQETTLIATLLPPEKPAFFTPENNPDRDVWFYIDPKDVGDYLKIETAPYWIQLNNKTSLLKGKEWPTPYGLTPKKSLPHLQYAFTWYSLCLILGGIGLLSRRKTSNASCATTRHKGPGRNE